MADAEIRISRPGVDALGADDIDLVWSSNFRTFKVFMVVTFEATGDITHGLGYEPTFFVQNPNSSSLFGFNYVSVDDSKLYCGVDSDPVTIILMVDPLNE